MATESISRVTRESIIARSLKGDAMCSFETVERAKAFFGDRRNHTVKLFKQTVTEEEIVL